MNLKKWIFNADYDEVGYLNYKYFMKEKKSMRSINDEYKSFHVYFFRKNGKMCTVGINGVKFYQD